MKKQLYYVPYDPKKKSYRKTKEGNIILYLSYTHALKEIDEKKYKIRLVTIKRVELPDSKISEYLKNEDVKL